jgi:hypothetical protein
MKKMLASITPVDEMTAIGSMSVNDCRSRIVPTAGATVAGFSECCRHGQRRSGSGFSGSAADTESLVASWQQQDVGASSGAAAATTRAVVQQHRHGAAAIKKAR